MKLQQIRNATLKIMYGDLCFLVDPWLQDKGTGFSADAVCPEMRGIKCPMNELPSAPSEILKDVDYCLVTHVHPDHFTPDYLPTDINILVQNDNDLRQIQKYHFENIAVIGNRMRIKNVMITKTPAVHGVNKQLSDKMGAVSGYILTGEDQVLYLAGDTIFNDAIAETLNKYKPDVIVVNCCEATNHMGRLIMNLDDVKTICKICPKSTIVATHLDSVNHALVDSNEVRQFAIKNHLPQILVPKNGEWIER